MKWSSELICKRQEIELLKDGKSQIININEYQFIILPSHGHLHELKGIGPSYLQNLRIYFEDPHSLENVFQYCLN